jgi:magnesium transporter
MPSSIYRRHVPERGAPPGTFARPSIIIEPRIHVMSYRADDFEEHDAPAADEIAGLLRPGAIHWVDVQGLGDGSIVAELGELFGLHLLAISDAVNLGQRPKADSYEGSLFVTLRMAHVDDDGLLVWEQVSVVLGENFVLTLQETHGDCLDPLRGRIRAGRKRIRSSGADFLACMVVDAIVDEYFPILEHYGDQLEDLEERVLERARPELLAELYVIKRDLVALRRATWPLREALQSLLRDEDDVHLGDHARLYLRDTVDHVMQVVDVAETYRELSASLVDVHLSMVGQQTNDVMRVLTVIATIFIPLTFVAGVYGMNFDTREAWNLPELGWRYGYLFFWAVSLTIAGGLVVAFRRWGWLGRR